MNSANKINSNHLSVVMAEQGILHKLKIAAPNSVNTEIAKGELQFSQLPSGIGVHCCDMTVNKNANSLANIAPCLSLCILIQGGVDYSLGNCSYHFEVDRQPIVFANLVTKEQVFTRHLFEKQRVKKVNVTVNKSALLARCDTQDDMQKVINLFEQKTCVFELSSDDEFRQLGELLIVEKLTAGMSHQLLAEQIALRLIAKSISLLTSSSTLAPIPSNKLLYMMTQSAKQSKFETHLETLLDQLVDDSMSLKEVAQTLGISVSTLQRRVKSSYQVTTFEYVRNKKLERARRAIVIEGKSIGEAAFLAGYKHVANFVTAFKKNFDITPAQLRNLHHQA